MNESVEEAEMTQELRSDETADANSQILPTTVDSVRNGVIDMLRTVFDPEIPVNIYDMGLIYDVDVAGDFQVGIRMTLTSPMCPVAETLPPEVEAKARTVAGVAEVRLDLVWDPPWDPSMMSEAARLELGM